jgi:acetyl-CoA carboxylase biotin carboxyl carrier protein
LKNKPSQEKQNKIKNQKSGTKMKTDLKYIQKLIKMIDTSNLSEIEIEEEGTKLRLAKQKPAENIIPQQIQYSLPPQQMMAPPVQTQEVQQESKKEEKVEIKPEPKKNLIEMRSPIVGTFYRAPSPTADPYVQVGQTVSKGTIICIIEAMKLMNEIECEYDGKIAQIMVENSKPVEYNQVLFIIEPL